MITGCSGPTLPPIPEPTLEGFAAAVRDQLRSAQSAAVAEPLSAGAVGKFGQVLYTYGQFQSAGECFERSLGLEPDRFDWAYLLGVARAEVGQVDLALTAFLLAAEMRPTDLSTALRLADLLGQSGESTRSGATLREALRHHPNAPALHYRVGRLVASDDPALAVEHLEAALAIEPSYREAHYAIAGVLQSLGRVSDASGHLESYERTDPTPRRHYPDPLLDAMNSIREASVQEMFNGAHALQLEGQGQEALARYTEILEIDPNHVQTHVNLVAVYGQLGDYERSGFHFEQSVGMDASISEAHYNHGVSRHFAGEFEAAVEAFRRALELNPLHADSHSNLGTSLEALGREAEAARHYRDALRHSPSHAMANFHIGRRIADQGLYKEALPHLEAAVATETEATALHAFVLALVHRELGHPKRSREFGELALRHARERGATELAAQIEAEIPL